MRIRVTPGATIAGTAHVPSDKSIAHRWLLLAAAAGGRSTISGVSPALDVASTARACAALLPSGADDLREWVRSIDAGEPPVTAGLVVGGPGRKGWRSPDGPVDCGNSGTTMRLLMGLLAASPVHAVLDGDASLRVRPMDRVAEPLRRMGAAVDTADGHAPVTVRGAALHGIRHEAAAPSAQVKSAILLAGVGADGRTEVVEPAPTRDHTERALGALGARVTRFGAHGVRVERFDVPAFHGSVPGDVSSAAYLAAAAVVTGGEVEVEGCGCNPTRTRFLDVLGRMGAGVEAHPAVDELGEPVGSVRVAAGAGLRGVTVDARELPLVVDEVAVLAALAAHADGESRFEGAGELRVKESDRLGGLCDLVRAFGGGASIEGDALVVEGGGLAGGSAGSNGDHRMAMSAVVGALAAKEPCEIDGVEAAAVTFPGFLATMIDLGAEIEVLG